MTRAIGLPGLERLTEVCRRNGIPVELEPPSLHPPQSGEGVGGLPFDPVLAAVYARSRRMAFGELDGFHLYRVDDVSDLVRENEEVRWGWPEVFRTSLIVFAGEPALLYCFATVPGLADADGIQPVVKIDPYEDVVAIPVASSVDRFFDAYSHALERRGEPIHFPWGLPDVIARDTPLVELLRAGRFDFLMGGCQDIHQWVGKVLAAANT